jgi:hypothetical protein
MLFISSDIVKLFTKAVAGRGKVAVAMATRIWTPAEVTELRIDGVVHDRCSSSKAYLVYRQLVRLTRTSLAIHSDRRYHFKKEKAGP